jgi:hypothetical protein
MVASPPIISQPQTQAQVAATIASDKSQTASVLSVVEIIGIILAGLFVFGIIGVCIIGLIQYLRHR